MSIIVKKFGGTSVGSPERIKNIARRLLSEDTDKQQVVVVSAMGDTTDHLIKLAKEMSDTPTPREYDALVSTGENISAALLAIGIQSLGGKAISLTGPQAGIKTESLYSKAKIMAVDSGRLKSELAAGNIVIVTGFQGLNIHNDVTTIGRGGSDTSAVVLAAALGSSVCEIYTDVDGVYTTDPRVVSDARKLAAISYDEMLEMSSLGATVLHPRAVECARENGITLHVRSSFNSNSGTMVKEASNMEVNKVVTGIALDREQSIVSILNVEDQPGAASQVFTALGNAAINVDMIIQSTEEHGANNITFTVSETDVEQANEIMKSVANSLGAKGVKSDSSIAKVSIIGVGMISRPGIAAKMFEVLGNAGINIKLISTSEIKISCAIARDSAKQAVQLLHEAFELEST